MLENVEVVVKFRPAFEDEKEKNLKNQWEIRNYHVTRVDASQGLKRKRDGVECFYFDHIFNERRKNNEIFESVVKDVVTSAVKGINGTIIAYGHSNSGKTYTMQGVSNDHGIIPLAIKHMFDTAESLKNQEVFFKVSYFEIYKGKIYDLIDSNNVNLKLRPTLLKQCRVEGCKELIVYDTEDVWNILVNSNSLRRTCGKSNKGHTILRIFIETQSLHSENTFSQLNLVDLAGHTNDNESKEDFHINMSLSLLNIKIVQLNKSSDTCKHTKSNLEDDALLQCLITNFGGNTKTVVICTVSPVTIKETQSTLWFAYRVSTIINHPRVNKIKYYKCIIVKKMYDFHKFFKSKIQNKNLKLMGQKIDNYRIQHFSELSIPLITEYDVYFGMEEFKLDVIKLHEKLFHLDSISNSYILSTLQSIESDLYKLVPKVNLLSTFINVLFKS